MYKRLFSSMEDQKLKERAKLVIPNGMYGHQGTRFLPCNWPQFYQKSEDCYLWDVDGKKYIDYLCGYGPIVLGKVLLEEFWSEFRLEFLKVFDELFRLVFRNRLQRNFGYSSRNFSTVKLGDKEHFDKVQIAVKEPFSMTKCQFTS